VVVGKTAAAAVGIRQAEAGIGGCISFLSQGHVTTRKNRHLANVIDIDVKHKGSGEWERNCKNAEKS
jgi:hypothetical protein